MVYLDKETHFLPIRVIRVQLQGIRVQSLDCVQASPIKQVSENDYVDTEAESIFYT